jgi:HEPN domain-containing protein
MADEPAFSAATFLGKAQDDLRTAEILLREPLSPRWPIGFHLQQAAEKAFKALIAAGGIEPPRTHSLRLLAESVAPAHPRVAAFLGRVAPLQAFAVQQRYGEEPAGAEAMLDMEAMRALVAAARDGIARAP